MGDANLFNMTIANGPSKFIWFRVAKTGTRSTLAVLRDQGAKFSLEQGYKVPYDSNDFFGYFKFSFVRNPYSRLVSAWQDKIVNGGRGGGKFEPGEREKLSSFDRFLDWVAGQDPVSINNHYRPQALLIPDKIDVIGRFENYGTDLFRIIREIGLPILDEIPHRNRQLMPTGHSRWTKRQLDIVSEYYRADFERFGYEVQK
jgi:hypothetical protein